MCCNVCPAQGSYPSTLPPQTMPRLFNPHTDSAGAPRPGLRPQYPATAPGNHISFIIHLNNRFTPYFIRRACESTLLMDKINMTAHKKCPKCLVCFNRNTLFEYVRKENEDSKIFIESESESDSHVW